MFHNLIELSLDPLTMNLLSGDIETLVTSFVCPTNLVVVTPLFKSHNLKVLSHEEERANSPSELKVRSETKCPCPLKLLTSSTIIVLFHFDLMYQLSFALLHQKHFLFVHQSYLKFLDYLINIP